ncbi:MAG: tetratricopeptide repeat protein [Treponema sp.]|jgi:tetratricopeptide (TPR) repeat protein|nr:tetratricopeptide repeat protein [Treponema sp.]
MEQNKKSPLLLAAVITGFALWLVLAGVVIYHFPTEEFRIGFVEALDNIPEPAELDAFILKSIIVILSVLLAPLVLAAGLTLLGRKKGNAAMLLIAGILYIVSVLGIPSAVLCFIGRARLNNRRFMMKIKQTAVLCGLFMCLVLAACDSAEDLMLKGNASFEAGDFGRAAGFYGRAIKKAPTAELYCGRSAAYYNQNNLTAALEDLNAAIGLDGNYSDAYGRRGALYFALEEYEDALGDLDRYIKAVTDDSEALTLRGIIYFQNEQYSSAAKDFNMVLRFDPENEDARKGIAQISEIQRQAEQQAEADLLNRFLESSTGDAYTDLYNFGYNLGLELMLGN